MKFNYPELNAVPFKGMRFYETPQGKFYPSVTTVLGLTTSLEKQESLKRWQNSLGMTLAEKKTKEASDRGSAVHLLAERYLKKEPLDQGENFSSDDMKCFNALKLKLNKVEEIWCQETSLYSDLIEVAGRTDLIGVYKGKESIIDYKTSTRIKNTHEVEDYRLQLTAYAIMHNELYGTDINHGVILMTSNGGFPQEFAIDLRNYVDKLTKRIDAFYTKIME